MRKLVEHLSYLPVALLRLMPKKMPLLTVAASPGDNVTSAGTEVLINTTIPHYTTTTMLHNNNRRSCRC